jgi:hypothetical protein
MTASDNGPLQIQSGKPRLGQQSMPGGDILRRQKSREVCLAGELNPESFYINYKSLDSFLGKH